MDSAHWFVAWNPMPAQMNTYWNSYQYFLHYAAKFSRHAYKAWSQEVRKVLKTHITQGTLLSLFSAWLLYRVLRNLGLKRAQTQW